MKKIHIENPIIKGQYPDPSICRVGEDYYLVCSSFELCPGLPVFHSRDLANWKLIGNAMSKENGLHVEYNSSTGGLMAPTIRYYNGTFYIINTNFCDKGNYIIKADNINGPWSMPYWLENVPGIDASLFIDDDGQVYIVGTGFNYKDEYGKTERGIWISSFDLETLKIIGEPKVIYNSAMRISVSPEAPHIYHVGEYYYLVIAEGGTEVNHSVVVARSKNLMEWYESCPANPVLTHRHMGNNCPITNVGHADLFETPDGQWYAVCLGSRLVEGKYKILGRETFLCPVKWENGWPLFSPETGRVESTYPLPEGISLVETFKENNYKDFTEMKELPQDMFFMGTPYNEFYSFGENGLCINGKGMEISPVMTQFAFGKEKVNDKFLPCIGVRQGHLKSEISCHVVFIPEEDEKAGIMIIQAMNFQIRFEIVKNDGKNNIRLVMVKSEFARPPFIPGFTCQQKEEILFEEEYNSESVILKIIVDDGYRFYFGEEYDRMKMLCGLSFEDFHEDKLGCFAGNVFGMFATGEATFKWISVKEII